MEKEFVSPCCQPSIDFYHYLPSCTKLVWLLFSILCMYYGKKRLEKVNRIDDIVQLKDDSREKYLIKADAWLRIVCGLFKPFHLLNNRRQDIKQERLIFGLCHWKLKYFDCFNTFRKQHLYKKDNNNLSDFIILRNNHGIQRLLIYNLEYVPMPSLFYVVS